MTLLYIGDLDFYFQGHLDILYTHLDFSFWWLIKIYYLTNLAYWIWILLKSYMVLGWYCIWVTLTFVQGHLGVLDQDWSKLDLVLSITNQGYHPATPTLNRTWLLNDIAYRWPWFSSSRSFSHLWLRDGQIWTCNDHAITHHAFHTHTYTPNLNDIWTSPGSWIGIVYEDRTCKSFGIIDTEMDKGQMNSECNAVHGV